jgi:hypothetical protein
MVLIQYFPQSHLLAAVVGAELVKAAVLVGAAVITVPLVVLVTLQVFRLLKAAMAEAM